MKYGVFVLGVILLFAILECTEGQDKNPPKPSQPGPRGPATAGNAPPSKGKVAECRRNGGNGGGGSGGGAGGSTGGSGGADGGGAEGGADADAKLKS